MGLILTNNKEELLFDSITISEVDSTVSLSNISGELLLRIELPFKISKIPPKLKDISKNLEEIKIFRNNYFNQLDVNEFFLKQEGQPQIRQALFFKLSIISEEEAVKLIKQDKFLQSAIFRSIIKLLQNKVSIPAKRKKQTRENLFSLFDFYDEDLIIGVFPYDWNPKMDAKQLTSFLFNANKLGFYPLIDLSDYKFTPTLNKIQETNYLSIKPSKSSKRKKIIFELLEDEFAQNGFFLQFIQNLVKRRSDPISRFHMLYQNIELVSDIVLKIELNKRICANQNINTFNGYKLKKLTNEISLESYRLNKFFESYSDCHVKNNYNIPFEILHFLELYTDSADKKELNTFGRILYEFRNQIVHNSQFVYSGNNEEIEDKVNQIGKLNNFIEYAIIDSIVNARFS